MPAYPTNFVPKADIAIYRAGAYVRSFPGGATATTRGTALLTAKAAAASGDTIKVGPGAYTLTTGQLLKNGVNWEFANGATVTMNRNTHGGLFDDSATWGANAAVTCTISGEGAFVRNSTGDTLLGEANCCVLLDNSSSNVSITCKSIADTGNTEGTGTSQGCVRHSGGTLTINCESITSVAGGGVWWSDGELYVDCDTIATCRSCVYSSANDSAGTGNGHMSDLWVSGHAWIRANKIVVDGATGTYASPVYTVSDILTPRVWVDAQVIENQGDGAAVNCAGNRLYVRAMKIFNSYASTPLFGTEAISCGNDGELWVNAQKVIGGVGGVSGIPKGQAVYFKSGKAWINIDNMEDNGSCTEPLIHSSNNDNGNASTLNLTFQTLTKTASGPGIKSDEALNTVNIKPGKSTVTSGQYDILQTAGTVNLQGGGSGSDGAWRISGTVNRLDVTGLSPAVTLTDGATPALNAALGKIFRLTAAGNRTIAVPSNPTDGQAIIIEHTASGGSRTLSLNSGTGGFAFTAEVTALTATGSGLTDRIGCIYNLSANKWYVVAYSKGA